MQHALRRFHDAHRIAPLGQQSCKGVDAFIVGPVRQANQNLFIEHKDIAAIDMA